MCLENLQSSTHEGGSFSDGRMDGAPDGGINADFLTSMNEFDRPGRTPVAPRSFLDVRNQKFNL
jgi:hypothetical protein